MWSRPSQLELGPRDVDANFGDVGALVGVSLRVVLVGADDAEGGELVGADDAEGGERDGGDAPCVCAAWPPEIVEMGDARSTPVCVCAAWPPICRWANRSPSSGSTSRV